MAIALVSHGLYYGSAPSVSVNFGSSAGRFCYVMLRAPSGTTINGVAVNGEANLTEVLSEPSAFGSTAVKWFYGPVTGTGSLSVVGSTTGGGNCDFGVVSLSGVGSYVSGTAAKNNAGSGTPTVTTAGTATSGDTAVAIGINQAGRSFLPGTSCTSAYPSPSTQYHFAETKVAAGAAVTLDGTWNEGGDDIWIFGGIVLSETGGGGGGSALGAAMHYYRQCGG